MAAAAKAIAERVLAIVEVDEDVQWGDLASEFDELEAICDTDPKLEQAYQKLYRELYFAKGALCECISDLQDFIKSCN